MRQPGYCGRFDWEIFSDSAVGGIRTQILFIYCGGGGGIGIGSALKLTLA